MNISALLEHLPQFTTGPLIRELRFVSLDSEYDNPFFTKEDAVTVLTHAGLASAGIAGEELSSDCESGKVELFCPQKVHWITYATVMLSYMKSNQLGGSARYAPFRIVGEGDFKKLEDATAREHHEDAVKIAAGLILSFIRRWQTDETGDPVTIVVIASARQCRAMAHACALMLMLGKFADSFTNPQQLFSLVRLIVTPDHTLCSRPIT